MNEEREREKKREREKETKRKKANQQEQYSQIHLFDLVLWDLRLRLLRL